MQTAVRTLIAILACATVGSGCHSVEARRSTGKLERGLQSTLDAFIATNPAIAGVALHVEMPRNYRTWSGAAGVADRATGVPLTPNQPVRIASNTKTFVATAILRLWEQGRLDLDGSVACCLAEDSVEILSRGGYDYQSMTIRHLLTHTSGLFDFGDSDQYSRLCSDSSGLSRFTVERSQQSAECGGRGLFASRWPHP
ncbi:MAG: beta-lactamase family protein [Verrucomicrobiales bacterium]|nr:beta-lactamase family protein [Verrucomicrobiales bacterium]